MQNFFCHFSSFVDDGCEIGDGTKIWHFSHVQSGAKIGKNCSIGQNVNIGPGVIIGDNVKIQNNVSVYEGVVLEDDTFIGPSAVFTNVINPRSFVSRKHEYKQTIVKRGASLGANCTIVCGSTIGEYSFVAAGAVVTRDVPPYALVSGVPAKFRRFVCKCGGKLSPNYTCVLCGLEYGYDDELYILGEKK